VENVNEKEKEESKKPAKKYYGEKEKEPLIKEKKRETVESPEDRLKRINEKFFK
jgi:hypothetical protein